MSTMITPTATPRHAMLSIRRVFVLLSVVGALGTISTLGIIFSAVPNTAFANEAVPVAADELTEKRLIAISAELRCLVCQNESLAGSHAELANDLRREIRSLIQAGKSDNEIMEFMVNRYGDFVRYRPPLKGTTLLLWFGPALFLLGGLSVLIVYLGRRNLSISDAPLSAEEKQRTEQLLNTIEPK